MIIRIEVETRTVHPGVITWRDLIDTITAIAPVDQRTPVLPGTRQTRHGAIRVHSGDST